MLSILFFLISTALIAHVSADNQFLIVSSFQWSSTCDGPAQNQFGYQFGACIAASETSAYKYNLTTWVPTTGVLNYVLQTFENTLCTGIPIATTALTADSTCQAGGGGFASVTTYAKGFSPWTNAISNGVVQISYYNTTSSQACNVLPETYYAQSNDYCYSSSSGSSLTVGCSASDVTIQDFSDSSCSQPIGIKYTTKQTCAPTAGNTNMYTTTWCGLTSSNYVASGKVDDDDTAASTSSTAMGVAVTSIILAVLAGGLWYFYGYIVTKPVAKRTAEDQPLAFPSPVVSDKSS